LAKIWTMYFLNVSLKHYHYTILFGCPWNYGLRYYCVTNTLCAERAETTYLAC
jgi:hypothetical protein